MNSTEKKKKACKNKKHDLNHSPEVYNRYDTGINLNINVDNIYDY